MGFGCDYSDTGQKDGNRAETPRKAHMEAIEQELYKLARKFQKKLQEEDLTQVLLFILCRVESVFMNLSGFMSKNKNVFLEKYLEGRSGRNRWNFRLLPGARNWEKSRLS